MSEEKKIAEVETSTKSDSKKDSKSTKKKNKKSGKFSKFFKEVWVELTSRIVWPTPKQIVNNTIVVIICCIIVGLFVFILDTGLLWLIQTILKA